MFEAESAKAYATRLFNEIQYLGHDRTNCVVVIAQSLREWEARGLESIASGLGEIPAASELQKILLVRAKELRGKSIDLA